MSNTNKKICVFGDSVAYGYSDIGNCGWVDRIKVELNYRDYTQIFNLGISGDDSRDVLNRFDSEIAARQHEIIIFAIGLNDTKFLEDKDDVHVPFDEFVDNINKLVSKAKKVTDTVIILGITPVNEEDVNPAPWNTNKSYTNNRIEKYNQALLEISKENNLDFIDFYKIFTEQNYKELIHDGLHPNSKGHKIIFNEVKNLLWDKYLTYL